MKKLVVTLALLGAVAVSYGQGTVGLANSATTLIKLGDASSVLPAWPNAQYRFEVYYAPVGTALPDSTFGSLTEGTPAGWTGAGVSFYGTNTTATTGGRISFGGNLTLTGISSGTSVNLFMRGWNVAAGDDLALNKGAIQYYGQSSLVTVIAGGGAFPNPAFFGSLPTQSQGFTLVAVPEPTSFALAGLGAAALLIFRRRN